MKIHTYKSGESIKDIAKKYGISEECLRESNRLPVGEAAIGEELLVLTPTRTHTLAKGDSLERLALRFGVRTVDILAQNPWISETGLTVGKTVNLKYDNKIYGTAPTNGYIYQNYDKNRLKMLFPYLTYITIGCAAADKKQIKHLFDDQELLSEIKKEGKIPLLRIYDELPCRDLSTHEKRQEFAQNIVDAAKSREYMGVVLASGECESALHFGEFLCTLRKAMIGCDLILITEISEVTPPEISELADGNILIYQKHLTSPQLSYEEGEGRCYSEHASRAESAKTFIDIPAFAYNGGFIGIEEACIAARAHGAVIDSDSESLISVFQDKIRGRCVFPSLKSIKRTYDMINDFGYMGASFDISKTPISHLLMYNAFFRTTIPSTARVIDGCSKSG